MDEGTTTFNENNARTDFYPGRNHHLDDQSTYLRIAGTEHEGEIMRRSAHHYTSEAYGIASYSKPATVLLALRDLLGEELFNRAYREYLHRWQYRHPYPWDLWQTFEDVTGRDLDWFWRSWYFETWTLDHAVSRVTTRAQITDIVIANHGQSPMPAHLTITFADGRTERRHVPVEHWLAGHREAAIAVSGLVTRVEIDAPRAFPDVNRQNNVWSRAPS
jgi:aminopeptidase N